MKSRNLWEDKQRQRKKEKMTKKDRKAKSKMDA